MGAETLLVTFLLSVFMHCFTAHSNYESFLQKAIVLKNENLAEDGTGKTLSNHKLFLNYSNILEKRCQLGPGTVA